MKIKIQPTETGGTLPYPYWINDDRTIGRQDFWKGRPHKLIGFTKKYQAGDIEVMFKQFWAEPTLAIGMFPVFADQSDDWYTSSQIIDSVQVKED